MMTNQSLKFTLKIFLDDELQLRMHNKDNAHEYLDRMLRKFEWNLKNDIFDYKDCV